MDKDDATAQTDLTSIQFNDLVRVINPSNLLQCINPSPAYIHTTVKKSQPWKFARTARKATAVKPINEADILETVKASKYLTIGQTLLQPVHVPAVISSIDIINSQVFTNLKPTSQDMAASDIQYAAYTFSISNQWAFFAEMPIIPTDEIKFEPQSFNGTWGFIYSNSDKYHAIVAHLSSPTELQMWLFFDNQLAFDKGEEVTFSFKLNAIKNGRRSQSHDPRIGVRKRPG